MCIAGEFPSFRLLLICGNMEYKTINRKVTILIKYKINTNIEHFK